MSGRYPTLLCAVDFSQRARVAMTYAAALADHFKARLQILNVALVAGDTRDAVAASRRLERFVLESLRNQPLHPAPELLVRHGEAGDVIMRTAAEGRTDLVIVSTHGDGRARGAYGSTAAFVLAHAPVPVLVLPPGVPEPEAVEAERLLESARVILAPVDFHTRAQHDALVSGALAEAFGISLVLLHVLGRGSQMKPLEAAAALDEIASALRTRVAIETVIAEGEPAAEISRIAHERKTGAIVMGLRGDRRAAGSSPGSIAYAVLCRASAPIIALPPAGPLPPTGIPKQLVASCGGNAS